MTLTWLITGCSSGLGLSITRAVLAQGHRVIATSRNPSKSGQLVEEVERTPNGKWITLDIKWEQAGVNAAIQEAIAAFGHIDVLVNNAGYSLLGTVEDVDEATARDAMETNFWGPWKVARAVIPHMRQRRSGNIVNISSTAGLNPVPMGSPYCCTKFALNAFAECLAGEVEHFGIRVIIVDLGAHDTGASIGTLEVTEAYRGSKVEAIQKMLTMPPTERKKADPDKAAMRIFEAVTETGALDGREKTLRLPLGEDAYGGGTAYLKRTLEEFERLKDVAASTRPGEP